MDRTMMDAMGSTSMPGMATMDMALLQACMDACAACEQACTVCAAQMLDCAPTCMNCADMCNTMLRAMLRTSGMTPPVMVAMLDACIAMCQLCMDECMRHADMSEVCRMCAQSCQACMDACMALRSSLIAAG